MTPSIRGHRKKQCGRTPTRLTWYRLITHRSHAQSLSSYAPELIDCSSALPRRSGQTLRRLRAPSANSRATALTVSVCERVAGTSSGSCPPTHGCEQKLVGPRVIDLDRIEDRASKSAGLAECAFQGTEPKADGRHPGRRGDTALGLGGWRLSPGASACPPAAWLARGKPAISPQFVGDDRRILLAIGRVDAIELRASGP